MNPCSVVPGLPKMRRTPSAMSCSIIARLPVILGMVALQESFEGFRAKDRAPPGYSQAAPVPSTSLQGLGLGPLSSDISSDGA